MPQQLMAAGILAKPVVKKPETNFTQEFNEREYQKWLGTHRDLPENIITEMALNRDRDAFIANHYVANKEKFGKTIMFAGGKMFRHLSHGFMLHPRLLIGLAPQLVCAPLILGCGRQYGTQL
ncbi:MAG: hypothetical protein ACQESR_27825 [Planctomycetota bacterium]